MRNCELRVFHPKYHNLAKTATAHCAGSKIFFTTTWGLRPRLYAQCPLRGLKSIRSFVNYVNALFTCSDRTKA